MKIHKNDHVLIIRGKEKGKTGRVLRGFPKELKILVEGVNIKKKHQRPRRSGEKGQIIEVPMPISVSKVKLICPECKKPIRVKYKIIKSEELKKETKIRVCSNCNKEIFST